MGIGALFVAWAAVAGGQVAGWARIEHDRRLRVALLTGVLALSTVHQLMFDTLAEDAFISFRYSLNLAEGNGLVFNAGERVEGYSNFLWVVLVAAPHAWFSADIVTTARVLGVVCTLACVLVGYVLTRRITDNAGAGMLAATIVAASSSLAAYGPSGLETPLFALLVLLTVLAVHAERPLVAGLLVALATMTRPDGVVVAAVVGTWLLVRAVRARGGWLAPLWFAAGAVWLAAPWTIWRVTYYGHLLPNAIAAKSGASAGWLLETGAGYLAGFAIAAQALLVLLPAAVFALVKCRSGIVSLTLAIAVTYVGFFVTTGGDWMPAWRFFAPAMPLFAVGITAACVLAWPAATRLGPVVTASVAALLLVASSWQPNFKPAIDYWHAQVDDLADMGTWLRDTMPAGTVIATFANGALSYEAGTGLNVVDLLGLTDEHIARDGKRDRAKMIGHQAHDHEYVIGERRPAVVFLSGTGYATASSCAVPAPFAEKYAAASFRVVGRDRWITVLLRKDRAGELAEQLDRAPGYARERCA